MGLATHTGLLLLDQQSTAPFLKLLGQAAERLSKMIAVETKDKPKLQTNNGSPKVYSYIRYSTPDQALGDSERRQLEKTKAYADKIKLPFDDTLRIADRGLSGYHGDHRKKGALGLFLHSVENETVPPKSVLVVENIDRLGREGAVTTLREIIFKLWDKDIILKTLSPEESFERGCENEPKFIGLMLYIQRAYDESQRKSERIIDARETARKNAHTIGTQLTSRCPAWLKPIKKESENRKNELKITFEPIPEAIETINLIYDLKRKGIGKGVIAKKLNAEATWFPPKDKNKRSSGIWRESYIQKILQNPAVIGEYQPYRRNSKTGKREPVGEPILDYYPSIIIDKNTFYAVQEKFKLNKGTGGRTGKARNLFKNLVKCPYCGGPMAYEDKGKPPKGGSHLVCNNGRLGFSCKRDSIRYDECEKTILENCKGLNPEQVLPSKDERIKLCYTLTQRIQGKKAELRDIEQRVENYDDQIGRTKDSGRRDKYESLILELEQQKKDIVKQIEDDEKEHRKAQSALQSFAKWQKDLIALQKGITGDNVELRIRLQHHLRELIEKIEVFAVGFKELYDFDKDNGDRPLRNLAKWKAMTKEERKALRQPRYFNNTETIENYLYDVVGEADPELVRSKSFGNFVKDLSKRRMSPSKEGRFLRIHFKTGAWIDVVPEGSIASGSKMYIDEDGKPSYKTVGPDIEKLWNQYKKKCSKAG